MLFHEKYFVLLTQPVCATFLLFPGLLGQSWRSDAQAVAGFETVQATKEIIGGSCAHRITRSVMHRLIKDSGQTLRISGSGLVNATISSTHQCFPHILRR